MDIMNDGLLRFWQELNNNNVLYIMVGGFAVNMHGYIRATVDADLLLKDDFENRQRLRQAFVELGYGDYQSLETTQFVPGWSQFYIEDGIVLDIMTELKGVNISFDECLKMASIADIEGVKVPFLHINHLIENKKVVNRPKDQLDVIELERIKKMNNEGG